MERNLVREHKLSIGARVFLKPEVGVLLPIVALVIFTSIMAPNFATWTYISTMLIACIYIGGSALGESLVIMSGEIDLSVGMSGSLAGIMCGYMATAFGLPAVLAIMAGLGTGALVGLVNGILTAKVGITSWISTLATQFICQGLAVTISQGEPMSLKSLGLSSFTRARPLGLTWLFFIFIALIFVLHIVVRRTRFGFNLRAVGGNKEAALLAGINVNRTKILVFVLAGVLAAVGGLFDAIQQQGASWVYGTGREFRAIICCAIGGISMSGGKGSIFSVALGVLLFHTLWYCLRILKVDTNIQLVLIGIILILSVVMDMARQRMEAKAMV